MHTTQPVLSDYFLGCKPSAIRGAQMQFANRTDAVDAINTAIGNVSLPMHPSMQQRMFNLDAPDSPFAGGVVGYTSTVGTNEARQAFANIFAASGLPSGDLQADNLHIQITDGGSQAMSLVIAGTAGAAGVTGDQARPIVLLDPAYTNYSAMAARLGRSTVSVGRSLSADGVFSVPDFAQLEQTIATHKPSALIVIPYDNPTGQLLDMSSLEQLARLCVKHNLWLISDEAYRELQYVGAQTVSVWALSESVVPGITGRRMSIESASKLWNACGLRIGALVTDNKQFHEQAVAENTASLCSSAIGQYVFGALAGETHQQLQDWFAAQRQYYGAMLQQLRSGFAKHLPELIVSQPDAALYSVIDVREVSFVGDAFGTGANSSFSAADFIEYCAREGVVEIDGAHYTLLAAPMAGFYASSQDKKRAQTQMRIACVETPERMQKVPELFVGLLRAYCERVVGART